MTRQQAKNQKPAKAQGKATKSVRSPKATPLSGNTAEPPPKRVYLIRHGESLGQVASKSRRARDVDLIDCDLSMQGEFQAQIIPRLLGSERYQRIGFVVSSPLTRAVKTSVMGFPTKNIIIHYDIAELGSIPENQPRRLKQVVADTGGEERIDGSTFAPHPETFPKSHEGIPGIERKQRVMSAWPALWKFFHDQKCEEFAIVCHYNIIRMALQNSREVQPRNAIPIECLLYKKGRIEVVETLSKPIQSLSEALGSSTGEEGIKQDGGDYDDEGFMVFD